MKRGRSQLGQASLEVVAYLPALLLTGLLCFQLLAVGYAAVLADHAAEAGALAVANGQDPQAAARDAVPGWSRAHLTTRSDASRVRVELRPPSPLRYVAKRLIVVATASVATTAGPVNAR